MIDKIEQIYKSINIYRSIIIANANEKQETLLELQEELENNNHSPLIITNKNQINYNYRIFIITDINLLSFFDKNSYNLIIIYS
jgi:hypothetical protein